MKNIIVRMCNIADMQAVSRIRIDAWRQAFVGIIDQDILDSFDYETETQRRVTEYNERKTGDLMCVAEIDGAVRGFCLFDMAKETSLPNNEKNYGEIVAFYVEPNLQRSGIGKAMFDFVSHKFLERGINRMVVWTLTENKIGRNFYEKIGGNLFDTRTREIKGQICEEVGYIFSLESWMQQKLEKN
ncbi:MAG: GNAT family N-acetyltransferase [Firmicutes bacterium]|nr:GNAT family N-acetyltransferase [Bacillota bacterium]